MGEVRAWRPKSGHLYFATEGREKLFAWLPAVPHGLASVRYKIGNEEHRASGSGYHDHNWGECPHADADHNVLGARQRRSLHGSSHPTSQLPPPTVMKRRSSTCWPRTARSSLTTDAKVSFERDRVAIDSKTGKPVADITR